MKLDIDTPLDSYSLAAMARTEDILGFLVEDLNVVGSKDAFKNILYGVYGFGREVLFDDGFVIQNRYNGWK